MDVREKTASKKRLIDYDEIRRLFDAQYKETVQLIHDGETHLDNLAEGFIEADRIIWKIPTVDAVEVLRCRDCEYWGDEDGKLQRSDGVLFARCKVHNYLINGRHTGWCPTENDFCSYGERKEGDD